MSNTLKHYYKKLHDLLLLKRTENIQNLITIVVTDGQFSDKRAAIDMFKKLKDNHVHVVWIYVIQRAYHYEEKDITNSVNTYIEIDDISKLSKELEKLVIKIQKDINQKIQHGTFY